jgi:hypothetical protein
VARETRTTTDLPRPGVVLAADAMVVGHGQLRSEPSVSVGVGGSRGF